jgi:hypothetical protein
MDARALRMAAVADMLALSLAAAAALGVALFLGAGAAPPCGGDGGAAAAARAAAARQARTALLDGMKTPTAADVAPDAARARPHGHAGGRTAASSPPPPPLAFTGKSRTLSGGGDGVDAAAMTTQDRRCAFLERRQTEKEALPCRRRRAARAARAGACF